MGDKDDEVLRVKGSSSATSLAAAISHGVYDNKTVVLRAIGAGAVNQAVKAMAIASGYCMQRGVSLSFRPGFSTVQMPDQEVTAMTFKVLVE